MTTEMPYHLHQIERTLPYWSRQLPKTHARAMLATQRKDYLHDDGQPFDWYVNATHAQRQALHSTLDQRDHSRSALHKALDGLKGITEFCKPLLEQRLNIQVPVDQAVYFFQPFKRRPSVHSDPEPGLGSTPEAQRYEYDPDGKPRKVTLLEAAMHNFADSSECGPYSLLHHGKQSTTALAGWTPASFIEACRELNLGQQYQDHLALILGGPRRDEIERTTQQAMRDELKAQAMIAVLRGTLSSQGLEAVSQFCTPDVASRSGRLQLRCWRLSLFQVPLHEVLVLGTAGADNLSTRIIYIPGAHDCPVMEYASASEAATALATRMQDERLLRTIIGYAPQPLQAGLATRLRQKLFDTLLPPNLPGTLPKPSPRLLYQATELPSEPWAYLYRRHVSRLKADAAALVVPTANVDADTRLEQFEHWLSIGLDLANVAALFIPGLNTVMLAIGGAQLMNSVFHGIEAWEADDKAAAAAQLESVLLNLAVMGTIGAGAAVFKQSRFVDSLVPIEHQGAERLWQPDLAHYASPEVLPDTVEVNEQGQYLHQQRHFIRLNGTLFEQAQAPAGQWQIVHPTDAQAFRPGVRHIGQGAWRAVGEHPLDWQQAELLRRIGPVTDSLSDTDLATALRSTGIDEAAVRHAQVSEEGTPPLLADAIERLAIDQEAGDLITRVRHGLSVASHKQYALNSLVELEGWPADHVLKVFDGPEPWGNAVIHGDTGQQSPVVIEITRNDLELGRLSQAVLDQLEEQSASALVTGDLRPSSRAGALNDRLADQLIARREALFDALFHSRQPALDNVAEPLRNQFGSLPNRVLNEIAKRATTAQRLRMLEGRVPLAVAEEARALQAQLRLNRALLGVYRSSLANADSQRLTQALLAENPGASAATLLETALADRGQAARLIGQQPIRPGYRSPMRLVDGRLGYPLSGRGGWFDWVRYGGESIEERRLQELYPGLPLQQRRTLLRDLRRRGNVREQLDHLQRERAALDQTLYAWRDAAEGEAWQNRRTFGRALRRAARQDDGDILNLRGMTLETLPELTARFDHIDTLHIDGLGLHTLPSGFFESFPRLQWLRLTANPDLQADTLFNALRSAPQLRTLEILGTPLGNLDAAAQDTFAGFTRLRGLRLRSCQLSIDNAYLQVLRGLPLEDLDLSENQITLAPGLAAHFNEMRHLRRLNLSHNPLGIAPGVANLRQLNALLLNQCELVAWPDDLTTLMSRADYALRSIQVSGNQIHTLPTLPQLLATPYAQDLLTHHQLNWQFHYNNLPPEVVQPLRTIGVAITETVDFLPPAQGLNWRAIATEVQQQLWDDVFEGGSNTQLREVVERVGLSAQAQHNQQSLAREVWQLLQAASEDQALLEHLNEVAGDFPATCGDAGADGFSTLQVEAMAYRESSQDEIAGPYLFQFYRQLFRREQVNTLAARIHAARLARQAGLQARQGLPAVSTEPLPALDELDDISDAELLEGGLDDIETRLALRQELAPLLDFPEPSQDMLYRQSAHVTPTMEDNVETAVTALDDVPANRRAWIGAQPSWRRFLRRRFSQRFAALDERWYQGIDYLEYCLDADNEAVTALDVSVREVLNEVLPDAVPDAAGVLPRLELGSQQYNDALARLGFRRQAAEDALYQQLTALQDPNDQN